jgi:hypothetical protein
MKRETRLVHQLEVEISPFDATRVHVKAFSKVNKHLITSLLVFYAACLDTCKRAVCRKRFLRLLALPRIIGS